MFRDRRISLPDKTGSFEDRANVIDLSVGESPYCLQLMKQLFVLGPATCFRLPLPRRLRAESTI